MSGDLAVVQPTLDGIVDSITSLRDTLQPALDNCAAAYIMVANQGIYEGEARAELETFVFQYEQKITQLSSYYTQAQLYIGKVEADFEYMDAQVAQMIGE